MVKTNEIDTVSPNNAVNVLSNLNVYGELRVDTIGNYDSLPGSISFVNPCVIGTALSNQPLTVNGTLIAKTLLFQTPYHAMPSLYGLQPLEALPPLLVGPR